MNRGKKENEKVGIFLGNPEEITDSFVKDIEEYIKELDRDSLDE
jgi:hypothetical protein